MLLRKMHLIPNDFAITLHSSRTTVKLTNPEV
jgi:hypothetical protein